MKTTILMVAVLATALHTNGGKSPARSFKVVKHEQVICTPVTLMAALKEYDIKNPEIVFAQAMLESAGLKSKLFLVNNNMFGMKMPEIRKTTAIGVHWKHAVYKDWIQCVKDYKLWQLARHITTQQTQTAYLQRLAKYAEDANYIIKVKVRINQAAQYI